MMIQTLSTTGLLLALIMLPTSVFAYITPEQALNDATYTTRFFEPPPTTRETQTRFEEQQRVSAERRAAAQAAIMPQPAVEEEEELHGAAPEEAPTTSVDDIIKIIEAMQQSSSSSNPSGLDPSTERLLLRIEAQQSAVERQNFINSILGDGNNSLHSGAPLADTGPATVFITLAIAGAIGETWRRVRKTERQMS